MVYLHSLNNVMPNEIADVKETLTKIVAAFAAYASGVAAAPSSATTKLVLGDEEKNIAMNMVDDAYKGDFEEYFSWLATPEKEREAFDVDKLKHDDEKKTLNRKYAAIVSLGRARSVFNGLTG